MNKNNNNINEYPLVSVIIPAYNASRYIVSTIQSVLNQSYKYFELIIIDDGSKDNTAELVKTFTDERIRYFYQLNQGVSVARNTGITKANGDYIAFLDADDIWRSENLEVKLNYLKKNPIDFVFGDVQLMDDSGAPLDQYLIGIKEDFLHYALLWDRCVIPNPSSNLLIKKSCFSNLNIKFDPLFSTAADQDFVFYLCRYFKGMRISEILVQYRNANNSMSKNIALMEKDHIAVYKKASRNMLFHSFWFKQRCFSNLYYTLGGSWFKEGKDKLRGIYYITYSIVIYPPHILKPFNTLTT